MGGRSSGVAGVQELQNATKLAFLVRPGKEGALTEDTNVAGDLQALALYKPIPANPP
jgi:hypothetical protein